MKAPSYADSLEVLILQASDKGRGPILFGDSVARARKLARPFMIGEEFPDVYLEFPLIGEPFLDLTFLYGKMEPGSSVDSPAAAGTEPMLDWYAKIRQENNGVSCGDAAHNVYEKLEYPAHTWPGVRYFAKEVYRELETTDRSYKDINPFKQSVCS